MIKLRKLFSPINIGPVKLKNRIVYPAIGSCFATVDGEITDRSINYYAARARGGAALITLENTVVHPSGKAFTIPALYDDRFIPGLRDLAKAVHSAGAKLFVQLAHQGRQMSSAITGSPLLAPSPIPSPMYREIPREMSKADIEVLVGAFTQAARRAQEAGCDGVEIHGAHGYLICTFLSPRSNKRTDEYGGSLAGRLKFALEIIRGIKSRCGEGFPTCFRISCDEMAEGGLVPDEVILICRILADAGIDALSISRGADDYRWYVPPFGHPIALNADFAGRVKRLVNIPVVVAGRIHDPLVAETILDEEKADLIAMGRALIADPDLPSKAKAGRFDDIIPCIACNQGCLNGLFKLLRLTCVLNPTVGRENEMKLVPAQKCKKVLIAGGGPAGLEAARVAAQRGHEVTLYEKTSKLGGQFNLAAVPPRKQEFAKAIQYLSVQAQKAGVQIQLGKEVNPELIEKVRPDVLIIATGGAPIIPDDIPGVNKPIVSTPHDVLAGKVGIGDKVVILGGGALACETAEYVGEQGAKGITITTRRGNMEELAEDMVPWARAALMERLEAYDVNILTSANVKEILDDGVVLLRNGREESVHNVSNVILARGVRSVDRLSEQAAGKVPEVYVIGDAMEPRQALEAIAEGAEVARRI
jgi:2,4-dienoyl-CoA reductase-like NADH-dependent reductase (Old Yellow Enzyme family)/thioredoxin reductase